MGFWIKSRKGYHTFPFLVAAGGKLRAVVLVPRLDLKTLEEIYMGSVHLDHELRKIELPDW